MVSCHILLPDVQDEGVIVESGSIASQILRLHGYGWHPGRGRTSGEEGGMRNRRYTIQPAPGQPFHVGRALDGRQFILGPMFSEVLAYVFDPEGHLISRERRTWRAGSDRRQNHTGIYWLFEPGIRNRVEEKVAEWKREIGLLEEPIVIDGFFDAESGVGIEDVPRCLEIDIEDESDFDRRERDRERTDWIQAERFIFWWELDCWMARDGTIR